MSYVGRKCLLGSNPAQHSPLSIFASLEVPPGCLKHPLFLLPSLETANGEYLMSLRLSIENCARCVRAGFSRAQLETWEGLQLMTNEFRCLNSPVHVSQTFQDPLHSVET